jgi:uncharacterized protein with PIN domain
MTNNPVMPKWNEKSEIGRQPEICHKCGTKISFISKRAAERALARRLASGSTKYSTVAQCDNCKEYHLA